MGSSELDSCTKHVLKGKKEIMLGTFIMGKTKTNRTKQNKNRQRINNNIIEINK